MKSKNLVENYLTLNIIDDMQRNVKNIMHSATEKKLGHQIKKKRNKCLQSIKGCSGQKKRGNNKYAVNTHLSEDWEEYEKLEREVKKIMQEEKTRVPRVN